MPEHRQSEPTGRVSDPTSLAANNLRLIGYWIDVDGPDLPDPTAFVDPTWDMDERRIVANYLGADRPNSVGSGCSPCRICGYPNGFDDFTDGVFQWPEGLAHYVGDHAVRLPDEVIQHATAPTDSVNPVTLLDRDTLINTEWWIRAMRQIR